MAAGPEVRYPVINGLWSAEVLLPSEGRDLDDVS